MQSNPNARDPARSSHVQEVNATSSGLVKAALGAAIVAGAILTFAWLPAEHGIDPTGVGHLLGLTEMGHVKEQLHAEADAETAAAQLTPNGAPDLNASEITLKLDAIQEQLTAIAASVSANSLTPDAQEQAELTPEAPMTTWQNEVEYTLEPGIGIEVKLVMDEGATAEYEWSANGAVVNHDTHGDGNGQSISYEKGLAIPEKAGQLTAAFTGNHGWYWRNRTDDNVLVTLRTRGNYKGMVLP